MISASPIISNSYFNCSWYSNCGRSCRFFRNTSMLSNLKEKLSHVQEGIVNSLIRDDSSFWTHQREYFAGAHLLSKYQHDWESIHHISEQNAAQAKAVDLEIEEINKLMKIHWHAVKRFSNDVNDLNIILGCSEKALNEIGNIRTLIDEVYHKIIEVEDLIEEDRLTMAISNAKEKLSRFHDEKLMLMDALKEKLSEDYETRLKVIDEEKDKIKKKTFQLAEKRFLEDFNAYKESGMLPKSVRAEEQQLKIEDIEIEQDLSVLEKYLDD